jgi:hypothetical protein
MSLNSQAVSHTHFHFQGGLDKLSCRIYTVSATTSREAGTEWQYNQLNQMEANKAASEFGIHGRA